jgi:hypothetical protein
MNRPTPDEYNPAYANYINLVAEEEIISLMETQLEDTIIFLKNIPEEKYNFRYAEGKWTLKEVLGHIIDNEIIFSYRALRIARNDKTPLPGYEQDDYVKFSEFKNSKFGDLINHFYHLREANIFLFKGFNNDVLLRTGTANNSKISVRAIAYIIVGHVIHHVKIIKERYLKTD